jgi:hypothetical protein
LPSLSKSSEFLRGLIARASSGGNSFFSISISEWSLRTIIDSRREGRWQSFFVSEDVLDEVEEYLEGAVKVDGSAVIGSLSDTKAIVGRQLSGELGRR